MKLKIQPKETVSTRRNICCSEKRKFPTFILGIGLESVNKKIYELAPNLILQLKALVFDSGMRLNNRISFSRNLSNLNQTCFNTSYRCWSIEIWGGQVNTSNSFSCPSRFFTSMTPQSLSQDFVPRGQTSRTWCHCATYGWNYQTTEGKLRPKTWCLFVQLSPVSLFFFLIVRTCFSP